MREALRALAADGLVELEVLLHTTVMGLACVYSIPHMALDDATILKAVRLRDEVLAVRLWQAKIDAALGDMATRL